MAAAVAADPEAGYNDRMAIQMLHFLRVFDFGDEFAFFAFQAASQSPLLSLRFLYMEKSFPIFLCRDFEELLRDHLPGLVRKVRPLTPRSNLTCLIDTVGVDPAGILFSLTVPCPQLSRARCF